MISNRDKVETKKVMSWFDDTKDHWLSGPHLNALFPPGRQL